jgi:S1-C subfamily serine protease
MVNLIAPPDSPARNTKTLGGNDVLPGLTVARINPAVIEELGLPVNSEGIVVLDPGRWGARAGLRTGDIITEINGRVIERPAQVAKTLAQAAPRIAITAIRGSQRIQLRFRA